ncbi:hypothetical protein SAMN03159496_05536 [Rhizobium sp. NFR07]|nr:hypothetical protein SAMN03159496_05536 [Rhizobium sp. NFR07]
MGAARRNRVIDRQDTFSELRANSAIHPGSQARALLNIAALNAEYPPLKL